MELDDRVAVITGGASGIGRACALAMAAAGADVVVADLNEQRMAEVVKEIEQLGRRALGVRTDVSLDADVDRLAATAIGTMGHIDLLMNNAGVVAGGPVESVSMSDWNWIFGINLLGPIRGVRAFLPHMLERRTGYIVNTASFAGLMAHNPLTIPYDTSKHGVMGLSQGLALYLRPKGIGVSVLCPGYVTTNLGENTRVTGMGETPDGPAHVPDSVVTPEEVAHRVVAAVREDRFLILSQDEHLKIVQRRWQDIDRHIDRQIEHQRQAGRPAD
ncbi:MAG: SDR family NAD(P)-dependent oxidoreductase [Candidatus Dormibacteraeota bacterium]|nr:SDR family NAD(P)-dependent oxidoreductase [Candidatus Dormibacteraeota bacterium]